MGGGFGAILKVCLMYFGGVVSRVSCFDLGFIVEVFGVSSGT